MSSSATDTRRPSGRVVLAVAGVVGLAAATTFTMAQWSDEATIEGSITTGNFEITVDPSELDYTEFSPETPQTSEHTLSNDSSVDAVVDLDIEGFDSPAGTWALTVELENGPGGAFTSRYEGDPSTSPSGIQLAGSAGGAIDLVLAPDEEVDVQITLELVDESNDSQDISLDDVLFTFNGEQVVEVDGDGDDG
ncbi:MAG: hypothetical protein ACTHZ5_09050 [Micrococcaceae bacterium]